MLIQGVFTGVLKRILQFEYHCILQIILIQCFLLYQAFSLNEYQVIKSDLLKQYNIQNLAFDENNYIIIVKLNSNNIEKTEYPKDYNKLKKYLSQTGYICSEE